MEFDDLENQFAYSNNARGENTLDNVSANDPVFGGFLQSAANVAGIFNAFNPPKNVQQNNVATAQPALKDRTGSSGNTLLYVVLGVGALIALLFALKK